VGILLMVIDGYFSDGYWCLLINILSMTIGGYSIGGYW
jgi:general stress protein CsbA